MGLKTFLNNIRYLTRYNIKEINKKVDKKLDYNNFKDFVNLLPYFDNEDMVKINILNVEETIDILVRTNRSLVRYGDGEFMLMDGRSIPFQTYNPNLSDKLKEIIKNNNENILVGVGSIFYKIQIYKYLDAIHDFIINYIAQEHKKLLSYIDYEKQYVSTEVSQLYQHYKNYDFENYFNKVRKIWENKEIIIVCGETVFNNIDYNIFDNSKSIDYIYAPSKNAFDKYEEILEKSMKHSKDKLFIIILGPTANILAYDLAVKGYRALDLGHISKDYDAYIKKLERNHKNIMNFFKPD